jgi:chaperone required for assembly of F1-ATPase
MAARTIPSPPLAIMTKSNVGPKRIYTRAEASALDGGFTVRLDDRLVRTPGRAKLLVPTLALAQALAEEWAEQGAYINPQTMPINQMAQSAIDLVSANLPGVQSELSTYAGTDLLCYRAEAPASLAERQHQAWQPWLDWAAEVFGARLATTDGVIAIRQDPQALDRLKAAVKMFDHFRLAALQRAVTVSGSLVLGLALARGALDGEQTCDLAEIDEKYQIERWGDDVKLAAERARRRRDLVAADRYFRSIDQTSHT